MLTPREVVEARKRAEELLTHDDLTMLEYNSFHIIVKQSDTNEILANALREAVRAFQRMIRIAEESPEGDTIETRIARETIVLIESRVPHEWWDCGNE